MPARNAPARQKTLNLRLVFLTTLAFVALLVTAIVAGRLAVRTSEHGAWINHTRKVEADVANLNAALERSETARRGYLLSADQGSRATWAQANAEIGRRVEGVGRDVSDNAAQVRRVEGLARDVALLDRLVRRSVEQVDRGAIAAARAAFVTDGSVELLERIRQRTRDLGLVEARLLAERTARQNASQRRFYEVLGATALLVVVVALLSLFIMRRFMGELSRSEAELQRLNSGLEDSVRERTRDLQRANEEIQRFAYIVSHDLRSPLVNVMGFTAELDAARKPILTLVEQVEEKAPEIASRDARLAVAEDLPEAIGFIRTSTEKMDRLIGAILKLSREGRRVIAAEDIAMEPLIHGIADALRHRTDELGATIEVEGRLPGLQSDRLAVEQIFSNLVENAVKYLKPGRPGRIMVAGRAERDRVIYEVRDNGRGIDSKDHQRVFDLFRRSGVQDQPGEGIGLAHVRSLVYRLGGLIELESTLDEGTTFRLLLPKTFMDKGERQS